MMERFRSRSVLGGAALVVLLSGACVRIAPAAWSRLAGPEADVTVVDGANPAAGVATAVAGGPNAQGTPGVTLAGRQMVAVRRGTIAEVVQGTARVSGQEEVPLSLPAPGRVQSVTVRPGQGVAEGQVLLEVDSKQIQRDLSAARARLESDMLRLRQAQAQGQAKQAEEERKRQIDSASGRRGVAEAQSLLLRAQADFEKVQAGAAQADRDAAEASVAAARAVVDRAEADLARLAAGPGETEVAGAGQQVTAARLALQKAEAELGRLQRGADPQEVRAAERDLALAQADLQTAQGALERVTTRDPYEIRAAEREVERAQIALQAAESLSATDATRGSRESVIANARVGLREAQERLTRLREPARPSDVEVARRNLDRARLAVEGAQERVELVKQGPNQLALDTAQAAVDAARLALQNTEARLQAVQAGAPPETITAAQNAVNAAKAQLTIVESRRAELLSHPTDKELKEAQAKLAAAQAAYERARTEAAPLQTGVNLVSFDVQLLQQAADSARAQVETIERELNATKLQAPFAGTVVGVQVRPGDPIEPGQGIIVMTKAADAVVRAELSDKDAPKVQPGQSAIVQLEVKDSQPIPATVAAVTAAENGLGSVAQLQLSLPEGAPQPAFGATGQASVTVQTKENVLLVPQKAVRSAGNRRYVEFMDGTNRRIADVQVGTTSGTEVEIVGGLTEGQMVIVPQ